MRRKHNNELINDGRVLMTNHGILSFKLFGKQYTTNHNRRKPYRYDDISWKLTNKSLWWRITAVYQNKVKLLKETT